MNLFVWDIHFAAHWVRRLVRLHNWPPRPVAMPCLLCFSCALPLSPTFLRLLGIPLLIPRWHRISKHFSPFLTYEHKTLVPTSVFRALHLWPIFGTCPVRVSAVLAPCTATTQPRAYAQDFAIHCSLINLHFDPYIIWATNLRKSDS